MTGCSYHWLVEAARQRNPFATVHVGHWYGLRDTSVRTRSTLLVWGPVEHAAAGDRRQLTWRYKALRPVRRDQLSREWEFRWDQSCSPPGRTERRLIVFLGEANAPRNPRRESLPSRGSWWSGATAG